MSLSIREATVQDAANIANVHVVSWRESYQGIVPQPYLDSLDVGVRTESWKSRLDQGVATVFVAVLDGQLCGFISGGKARESIQDFDGEFFAIYLLRAAKGRGIGRLLMRRLAETLLAEGLTKGLVWVLADNPTRHFYEHLGAQEVARKMEPVGGADLLEIAYGWQDIRAL